VATGASLRCGGTVGKSLVPLAVSHLKREEKDFLILVTWRTWWRGTLSMDGTRAINVVGLQQIRGLIHARILILY
jgi:hypothetical protein